MNIIQQEKEEADSKNSKLENKSPAMKAKSEVSKAPTGERHGHMKNDNATLLNRARVVKKFSRYDDWVM